MPPPSPPPPPPPPPLFFPLQAFGITVLDQKFDICKDLGLTCPHAAGAWTGTISQAIPTAAPKGVPLTITITATSGTTQLGCYSLKVTVGGTSNDNHFLIRGAPVAAAAPQPLPTADHVDFLFGKWMAHHNIPEYASPAAEDLAKANFANAASFVAQHNAEFEAGLQTFTTALNKFAATSNEEYRRTRLGRRPSSSTGRDGAAFTVEAGDSPDSFDWRTHKPAVVTAVKDQGSCGSCWAFSAVAAMEGRYALDSGKLTSFSEQEVVDCTLKGADTCNLGGEMHDGIVEIAKNHAGKINTEQQYPYTQKSKKKCKAKDATAVNAGITGYANVTSGDEAALKTAVATHPIISVGIDASSFAFQLYDRGIYNPRKCKNDSDDLDHGVAVVGYGSQGAKDYWIVKNSWNKDWGMKGYIWMARNADNKCGIATDAVFALSKKSPTAATAATAQVA